MKVCGTVITNSQVPFGFRALIGAGRAQSGKPMFHAGLLLSGRFGVCGKTYGYLFVDRWSDGIRVHLLERKQEALARIQAVLVDGALLTDCSESPEFQSLVPAEVLLDFLKRDFNRNMCIDVSAARESLQDDGRTNCVLFAHRAGMVLGGGQGWLRACDTMFDSLT
mmetsp:Transcript_68163/g.197604  ORF Transcript_68163/g.197604 Transcript_68163/m.197604 type:complete len:166 (-) Transcript_68163:172-669(-)